MLKYLFILLSCFIICRNVKAQKVDTLLYYMKNNGAYVTNKNSADYFLIFMPPDSSSGQKLYPVVEYYPNGTTKLTGMSASGTPIWFEFRGTVSYFFPNGNKQCIRTWDDDYGDKMKGDETWYYPNGKIYKIVNHDHAGKPRLKECRDSTGTVLAENGDGKWLEYDDDFKYITAEGTIAKYRRQGAWHGNFGDTCKYVCDYKNDKVIAGTGYDKNGITYPFTTLIREAKFREDVSSLAQFVRKNKQYPAADSLQKIQGRVVVSFTVQKNGSLDDIQAISSPSPTLAAEAVRIMKLSPPWNPQVQAGMPVSISLLYPIEFYINHMYRTQIIIH